MKGIAREIEWNTTFTRAAQLGINKMAAARMRCRLLLDNVNTYLEDGSDLALEWAKNDLDEVLYLLTKAQFTEMPQEGRKQNEVTQDMKDYAMSFPIHGLISSINNKAKAWCHNDSNPSLSLSKDKNRAFCNVCGKAFNSIDVVMHQQQLSWYQAIRYIWGLR